jgi:hypothetical protein
VEAAAGGLPGDGRDGEPDRRVPGRVAAAVRVRRGALLRDRVASDGGHRVNLHAAEEVHVL